VVGDGFYSWVFRQAKKKSGSRYIEFDRAGNGIELYMEHIDVATDVNEIGRLERRANHKPLDSYFAKGYRQCITNSGSV